MTNRDFRNQMAERGAQTRLAELNAERDALLAAFPGIGEGTGATVNHNTGTTTTTSRTARKQYTMSAAQKKAVSKRMRAYWAARRAEKEQGAAKKAQGRKTRPRKSAASPAQTISQQF